MRGRHPYLGKALGSFACANDRSKHTGRRICLASLVGQRSPRTPKVPGSILDLTVSMQFGFMLKMGKLFIPYILFILKASFNLMVNTLQNTLLTKIRALVYPLLPSAYLPYTLVR